MQWLRSAILVFLVYLLMAVMGIIGAPVVLWSRAWTSSRSGSRAPYRPYR